MRRKDDISSTEKLLSVIRGGAAESSEKTTSSAVDGREKASRPSGKLLSRSKATTVGVVIGHDTITMAAVNRAAAGKLQLIAVRKIPLKPGMGKTHPRFSALLGGALAEFCRPLGKPQIWSIISSARAEIRHIKIPPVAESQIPNAAYWTLKKLVPFEERDVIFDYDNLGDITEEGITRIRLLAFIVPRAEVTAFQKLFAEAGFPLTGVSIVPFALQNLFRTGVIDHAEDNACSLYIGQDWSRIDIYSRGDLVLSRDIKTGMNSFIESIRVAIDTARSEDDVFLDGDPSFDGDAESDAAEEPSQLETARRLFMRLIHSAKQSVSEEATSGYDEDDVVAMIAPVLERLIRQVERTLGHFSLNFGNEVVTRIFIAGDISGENRLLDLMRDQMAQPVYHIDPFDSPVLAAQQVDVPESPEEKDSFVPAIGMALSTTDIVPNFLFTYRHKNIQKKIERNHRAIFAVFALVITVLIGFFWWQQQALDVKTQAAARMERRLLDYSPRTDRGFLEQMVAKISADRRRLRDRSESLLGQALIAEIVDLTPAHIRLTRLTADLGKPAQKQPGGGQRTVTLEGMVTDLPATQESELALYMIKLNNSALFTRSTVVKKSVQPHNKKNVLTFTAKLETI